MLRLSLLVLVFFFVRDPSIHWEGDRFALERQFVSILNVDYHALDLLMWLVTCTACSLSLSCCLDCCHCSSGQGSVNTCSCSMCRRCILCIQCILVLSTYVMHGSCRMPKSIESVTEDCSFLRRPWIIILCLN